MCSHSSDLSRLSAVYHLPIPSTGSGLLAAKPTHGNKRTQHPVTLRAPGGRGRYLLNVLVYLCISDCYIFQPLKGSPRSVGAGSQPWDGFSDRSDASLCRRRASHTISGLTYAFGCNGCPGQRASQHGDASPAQRLEDGSGQQPRETTRL